MTPAGAQPQTVLDRPSAAPPLEFDLTIIGGGIVGLTLACALKSSGLRIALVETQPRDAGLNQHRAYALTLMTGRIYQGLGIWDQILPHITTFHQIRLADATCPAVVDLQPQDLGTPELGYVGEHHVLVQALLEALADAPTITWLCPARLLTTQETDWTAGDGMALKVAIDGQEQIVYTRLLVAADGARSSVREQAGIGTTGWSYWQSCVTAVIRPEKSHNNVAREHFWGSGPFASLPLPGNRYQIVLTAPHEEANHWLTVEESEFLAELDRRYQGQLGRLELLDERRVFPVRLMQSNHYVQPRLALIGDAAHCCHPVGGQGMNLGIRDAAALAEILQQAHQQGEDVGDPRVLKRYERWRRLENWTILGFTDFLDRCFSTHWPPIVATRRLGLRLMSRLRPLRFMALILMTGLSGREPQWVTRQR